MVRKWRVIFLFSGAFHYQERQELLRKRKFLFNPLKSWQNVSDWTVFTESSWNLRASSMRRCEPDWSFDWLENSSIFADNRFELLKFPVVWSINSTVFFCNLFKDLFQVSKIDLKFKSKTIIEFFLKQNLKYKTYVSIKLQKIEK